VFSFTVTFTAPGMIKQLHTLDASNAEDAAARAWAVHPFGDAVDATVMGDGQAYRLRCHKGEWCVVDQRAIPRGL
jgi:hypothetical protein